MLGAVARHFLLMTATPHAGKEEDFQLFLALLDADRFEGRFRDGVHTVDPSDLMRRMVKEKLLTLRRASRCSPSGGRTRSPYHAVADWRWRSTTRSPTYVRERDEPGRPPRATRARAAAATRVGFALTVLQRRLASSPEAIYQSLSPAPQAARGASRRGAAAGPRRRARRRRRTEQRLSSAARTDDD